MYLKHLIFFSLCLLTTSINANVLPGSETQPVSNENEETKPEQEDGKVEIIKISDSYAVVRIEVKSVLTKIFLNYGIEKSKDNWVYSEDDASVAKLKLGSENIARRRINGNYQYDMNVTNIKPGSKIKLKFVALSGKERVALNDVVVKTLLASPVTKITSNLLTLNFESSNAAKYFAKVTKIKDGKESDCVLEVTMSSCFGNSLGLPGLIPGEKYSIESWYVNDNIESEHTVQEITA